MADTFWSDGETIGASVNEFDSSGETGTGDTELSDAARNAILADCTAEWLSSMEALRPDLVRTVPAHGALRQFGAVLRGHSACKKKLYNMSKEACKIDEFWSHSWHVEAWKKVLCLLFLKNGLAAAFLGTVACLAGCTLTISGWLPSAVPFQNVSLWGSTFGVFSYLLTLGLWRPQQQVFLDIACIDQDHVQRKNEGILSIGKTLKQSKTMLALWDVTFVQRLWCIFELAAFLKSHQINESSRSTVVVRPVLFGPCSLAIFGFSCGVMLMMTFLFSLGFRAALLPSVGSMFFFIMYPAASTFRDYFRSMDSLNEQLRNFSICESYCHCCTLGHEDASSPCDRDIVLRCIRRWFDSENAFEERVRTLLPPCFAEQLGRFGFPYWLLLVATCPMLWFLLDLAVAHWLRNDSYWIFWLGASFSWWLGAQPFAAGLFFLGAKLFRRPAKGWRNICKNFCVIALNQPILVFTFGLNEVLIFFQLSAQVTALVAGCVHISLAVGLWFLPGWWRRWNLAFAASPVTYPDSTALSATQAPSPHGLGATATLTPPPPPQHGLGSGMLVEVCM